MQQDSGDINDQYFKGYTIFINGYTNPSANILQNLFSQHGGSISYYNRSSRARGDKFIEIATNVSRQRKLQVLRARHQYKIVHPDWIVHSCEKKQFLKPSNYELKNYDEHFFDFIAGRLNDSSLTQFVSNKSETCSNTNFKYYYENLYFCVGISEQIDLIQRFLLSKDLNEFEKIQEDSICLQSESSTFHYVFIHLLYRRLLELFGMVLDKTDIETSNSLREFSRQFFEIILKFTFSIEIFSFFGCLVKINHCLLELLHKSLMEHFGEENIEIFFSREINLKSLFLGDFNAKQFIINGLLMNNDAGTETNTFNSLIADDSTLFDQEYIIRHLQIEKIYFLFSDKLRKKIEDNGFNYFENIPTNLLNLNDADVVNKIINASHEIKFDFNLYNKISELLNLKHSQFQFDDNTIKKRLRLWIQSTSKPKKSDVERFSNYFGKFLFPSNNFAEAHKLLEYFKLLIYSENKKYWIPIYKKLIAEKFKSGINIYFQ
ncbi:MAG: deoxycytidyl transferase [Marteilia pararefringens]